MRPAQKSGQSGLTLIELLFALAMASILLVAVTRYVAGTRAGLLKQEVNSVLTNRSARISANLRTGVGGARLLLADYGGAPDFSPYRTWVRNSIAAKAPATPAPAAFTLPPLVSNSRSAQLGSVSVAVREAWGNELLYLANLQPVTLTVRYGTHLTAVAEVLSVDRAQFVYTYPALVRVAGLGMGLRLVEWRSQPFALYGSLSESTGERLTKTCEALLSMGYHWALDADAVTEPDQAWYQIKATGDPLLEADATGPPQALQSHWAYMDDFDYAADLRPRPGQDRGQVTTASGSTAVAAPASFVLAFNTVDPDINPTLKVRELNGPGRRLQVPAHALADRGALAGFPGGFEVAIVGRPAAREVVLRHVLMAVAATDPGKPAGSRMAYEGLNFVAVKNDF
jgi:prepilin-type N-terminal cleavage/methylation domain-containing protein